MIAWTLSGTVISASSRIAHVAPSRERTPRSTSIFVNSSANSGFPPACSSSTRWVSAGRAAAPRIAPRSCAVSSSERGESATVVEFRFPPPQLGRRS